MGTGFRLRGSRALEGFHILSPIPPGAAAAAALVLLASCGEAPAPDGREEIDIVALVPFEASGPATRRLEFAAASSRPHLLRGWSGPARAPDGSRGAWLAEREAAAVFQAGRAPAAIRLEAELGHWGEGGEASPEGLLVALNGQPVGGSWNGRAALTLPARWLRPGGNILTFRRARRGPGAGTDRTLFRSLTLTPEGESSPAVAVSARRPALLLPPGAEVSVHVRAPAEARLALTAQARGSSGGRLLVACAVDGVGERTVLDAVLRAPQAFERDLEVAAGRFVRLTFQSRGDGSAIEVGAPRVVGAAPAISGPVSAASASPAAGPRNVLLYVADTLRADRLGAYGSEGGLTPALDELAQGGVVFENAIAQAPWTRPAAASILTGLDPDAHGAVGGSSTLSPSARTAGHAFGRHGFATAGIVTNVNASAGLGFGRGFEHYEYLPEGPETPGGYATAATLHERGLSWLDGQRGRPFFLYLHANDVHSAYRLRRRLRPESSGPPLLRDRELAAVAPERLQALYDAAVADLDREMGRLLASLAARGLAETTVVAFLADHGEEFLDHGGLSHGHSLYQELLRVPFIVRVPGSRHQGLRSRGLARQVDVLPTLLTLAGLPAPPDLPGLPLLEPDGRLRGAGAADARAATWLAPTALEAVVLPPWKVVFPARGTDAPRLYDLEADPAERVDLAATHPALVGYAAQLAARRRAEAARVARPQGAAARRPEDSETDPATLERLRALGYLEGR